MELIVIELRGKRVLTTAQLAENYEAEPERIVRNFNRNKERYVENKHFFLLEGEELRDFRAKGQIDLPQNLNKLYLWTEKGAWLHAKSLNTDRAWEAYELLVDEYYKVIEQPPQYSSLEVALQAALQHEQAIKEIKTDVDYLKGNMRIDGLQQQEIQQAAKQSIVQALGGKDSIAYQEISKKVFSAFWNEFKQYFKVPRYGDIPKVKHEEALRFISLWRPSTSLQMEIDSCNSQMAFE
ncbi:ORF6C domain-containing protein [Lysinibacillus irui]|uniref:ORF6C domain-containing protein n=1 Tax=Lysinibacillus irui TaxID=2998077 RepID=A0ABU5NRH8_9BACI|nr:ORF6C domain-containing protein [Lysinibacillus irui]MEA0554622.1 ORF6C domain-containing protein [Lysinibacillus irui]MEA0978658.1 ORF6C domain-containing protein [Lysinibacillus irui]MEA1044812.1 ORF6C domain-containing protein [Lysinibacillus irui]